MIGYLLAICIGFLLAISFFKTIYLLVPLLLTIVLVFILKNENYYKKPELFLGITSFVLTHSHWYLSLNNVIGVNKAIFIWIGISIYFLLLWLLFFYILKYLLKLNNGYFFIPIYWVLFEWLMSLGTFGYPFMAIYLTQADSALRWLAYSIIDAYSISLTIISFSTLIALIIIGKIKNKLNIILFSMFFFTLFLVATNSYLIKKDVIGKDISVSVIQPNISQKDKINDKMYPEHLKKYFDLINKTVQNHQDTNIIILPENIIPALWEKTIKESLPFSTNLGNKLLIFGQPIKRDEKIYNSILFYKQGEYVSEYYKRKLVPFGEYLPLLSGWINLNDIIYYSPGKTSNQIINIQSFKIMPLICFESAFPYLLNSSNKFDLGIVLTNDAWFNKYFKELHLRTVRYRAIEKATPFAYSTNNGISALIDHNGNILKFIPDKNTGFISEKIKIPESEKIFLKKIFYYFPLWILIFLIILKFEHKTKLLPDSD